jgi:gamma-glutamyl:cysteine ligase YbdK (ATP-grasp superfamily)
MGAEIDRDHFDEVDYGRFGERLRESLDALAQVLVRPDFGTGPPSLGAELELALIDAAGLPLHLNRAVWAGTVDPRVALELDRFNLEVNTRPTPLAGRPFTALVTELDSALCAVQGAAAPYGGRVVMIGILPTLSAADLQSSALSDLRRFRAMSAGIRRLRRKPFEIRIEGDDPLAVECDDVTFEGANTSLQVHLQVAPADFACTYNAAQIAIAPVLAAAGNSPLFLGHRLWEETRIALYRQATDLRPDADDDWRPARVSFGHGWVRTSAYELFAENVALHPPLLPVLSDEDPLAAVRAGRVPQLAELRLHQGTTWTWNRAVYDPAGGGHLRIEMRALPAGPTMVDMAANAAFLVGLTRALAPRADRLLTAMTFGQARRNFYCAARLGLAAELLWPADDAPSPRLAPATELIRRLLPLARAGLANAGVADDEAERLLGVIRARVASGTTGARWQRRVLAADGGAKPRPEAVVDMLHRYVTAMAGGRPVHEWPG